ncbi:MAG TPA: sulfatase-like hydrolase/transferase, partial [Actinomycetota bacterium]|nr:sulfatase-like hydrolase/transferase [Actinomycetota bacterium]
MRRRVLLTAAAIAVVASLLSPAARATPVTISVNSTADPGTGTCDQTECTLREAITQANNTPSTAETIAFSIGGAAPYVIAVGTPLPQLQGPVTIDGTTQPGYAAPGPPLVEIDGNATFGSTSHGLEVVSGTATIRGLALYRFKQNGVTLRTSGNVVRENYIGTNALLAGGLGNSLQGVKVNAVSGNRIIGNLITGNKAGGVRVSAPGTGNTITGNRIYGNVDLEIDLLPAGVTPNDTGDGDTGANDLQNFPVLTEASSDGSTTTVSGTLNSKPSTAYTLEFFASAACEPSGNGPAERSLGTKTVTTASGGNAPFTVSLTAGATPGERLTATATDPADNTSELSACVIVEQPPGPPNVVIVMTDDQTPVSFPYTPAVLPYLQGRVLDPNDHWVRFTEAYVNVPICCPSRATLLTGQYAHHHDVQGNNEGYKLDEDETLPVWLHREGYATAMFGKYLNGFPFNRDPYKPRGWDRTALFDKEPGYTDYNLIEGPETGPVVVNHYGTGAANYSTDLLAARSVNFIDDYAGLQPFFLYYVPYAPHYPTKPNALHKTDFDDVRFTPRPANFNEADVSDKPTWVQQLAVKSSTAISRMDNDR